MSKRVFGHREAILYIIGCFKKEVRRNPDVILNLTMDSLIRMAMIFYEDFLIGKGAMGRRAIGRRAAKRGR